MGQEKQQHEDPPVFGGGIRGLGFGTADGYTHEQLEKAADLLNYGSGLLRNGAFFVGSDGEMCIVLVKENCGRNILTAGYRMAEITAKLCVLGMMDDRPGRVLRRIPSTARTGP